VYAALKFIGSLAPGPSKATRAYLHAEADVVAALAKRGFKVKRNDLTAGNFYYSRILEAVKE
jgi:magnesium-protoporphyrin O-methyltransferase